jgi:hypothetical protein
MPQMSGSQVRVVDPVLTEVARGYSNPAFVGSGLFPYVPVGVRGGKIVQFGKEAFRLYNTARYSSCRGAIRLQWVELCIERSRRRRTSPD